MDTVPNTRCYDSAPHAPHLTTFAPELGITNGQCPGVLDDGGFAEQFLEQRRISPDVVRGVAVQLAHAGYDIDPGGDVQQLTDRINELLAEGTEPTPPESEWRLPPACPAWCAGEHRGEEIDDRFRDCESEEMFAPTLEGGGGSISVALGTTFDRATGEQGRIAVRLDDYQLTSQYARHLGRLLIRAADLMEAQEV